MNATLSALREQSRVTKESPRKIQVALGHLLDIENVTQCRPDACCSFPAASGPNNGWYWTDFSPFVFTYWGSGQPAGTETCASGEYHVDFR